MYMYNTYRRYPCPYWDNLSMHNLGNMHNTCNNCQYPCFANIPMHDTQDFTRHFTEEYIPFSDEIDEDSKIDFSQPFDGDRLPILKDYGPKPLVININEATKQNRAFRTVLWTGKHMQVTLMSINVGEDIGLEIHPNLDQFIRIEEGQGIVRMGPSKDRVTFKARVYDDSAIMIPAGMWHNVINTGNRPLKVYAIYAPPEHPHGTVHITKADAEAAEKNHR